ncbi:hypothetical protein BO70DRAFT_358973 [Aspergillus heteromorphus CBS 117.55]|uniref:CENP-S associating centromere protein X-domain-containing protein n=1 Tax=Aspergillus heteromorphus CBS 117.55 TaxID=1448321 RepID=A0A317WUG0_9EURO|nr:uncharacterized protein BO70DRAFT_358973 [Aspergillus heteromorphus CBS 117.55]PWY89979.1 hypothetical protein BO70DRAFT_358973 [Aspergillus heteromorphus CBS 117.55]
MPPERQPVHKRRRLPFNPPSRTTTPATASASASTSAAAAASSSSSSKPKPKPSTEKKTTTTKNPRPSPSPAPSSRSSRSSNNGTSSPTSARSMSSDPEPEPEPDFILAEIIHKTQSDDILTNDPVIPPKLLTTLLHHHFQHQKTKVAKDANTVVAKYVDVFVREALARAAFERSEAVGKGASIGDGFLEVEDLEKMVPQLIMDF